MPGPPPAPMGGREPGTGVAGAGTGAGAGAWPFKDGTARSLPGGRRWSDVGWARAGLWHDDATGGRGRAGAGGASGIGAAATISTGAAGGGVGGAGVGATAAATGVATGVGGRGGAATATGRVDGGRVRGRVVRRAGPADGLRPVRPVVRPRWGFRGRGWRLWVRTVAAQRCVLPGLAEGTMRRGAGGAGAAGAAWGDGAGVGVGAAGATPGAGAAAAAGAAGLATTGAAVATGATTAGRGHRNGCRRGNYRASGRDVARIVRVLLGLLALQDGAECVTRLGDVREIEPGLLTSRLRVTGGTAAIAFEVGTDALCLIFFDGAGVGLT